MLIGCHDTQHNDIQHNDTMTLSIKGLNVKLSMNDTQHNNAMRYPDCSYAECHILFFCCAECHYAECRYLNVIMLSVAGAG